MFGVVPNKRESVVNRGLSVIVQNGLTQNIDIPEPTRSLLWVSDGDPSEATSPLTIRISFDLSSGALFDGGDSGGLQGEPSMIWVQLPVEKNDELENKPMYYPTYSGLSPRCRFQYLEWLKDITSNTNLSYVFLYYYGLERHLLIGNYDHAVDEILRLLKYHDRGTFRSYAVRALLVSSIYRHQLNILDKVKFLKHAVDNETLLLRMWAKVHLTAEDIIRLIPTIRFTQKRYIRKNEILFTQTLADVLQEFESHNAKIFDLIDPSTLLIEKSTAFANLSIPEKTRNVKIPQLVTNQKFIDIIHSLLLTTNARIKTHARRHPRTS